MRTKPRECMYRRYSRCVCVLAGASVLSACAGQVSRVHVLMVTVVCAYVCKRVRTGVSITVLNRRQNTMHTPSTMSVRECSNVPYMMKKSTT